MNPGRFAIVLGIIPIVVGTIYWLLQQDFGTFAVTDAAGALMLILLGVAMGFGFLVILRGARDL